MIQMTMRDKDIFQLVMVFFQKIEDPFRIFAGPAVEIDVRPFEVVARIDNDRFAGWADDEITVRMLEMFNHHAVKLRARGQRGYCCFGIVCGYRNGNEPRKHGTNQKTRIRHRVDFLHFTYWSTLISPLTLRSGKVFSLSSL